MSHRRYRFTRNQGPEKMQVEIPDTFFGSFVISDVRGSNLYLKYLSVVFGSGVSICDTEQYGT